MLDGADGSEVWSVNTANPVESVYPIKDIDGNGRYDILAGLRDGNILLVADGGPVGIVEKEVLFKENFKEKNKEKGIFCKNQIKVFIAIFYPFRGPDNYFFTK